MIRVSACPIARDESERIAGCLASLQGFVDEVVVLDTGSTDDTVARARAGGARVVEGSWNDSFAAARNASLDAATGERVLSLDADELVHADVAGLRQWLDGVDDRALLVLIRNPVVDGGHGYEYTTMKLFRRWGARWVGRVHERVVHNGMPVQPLRLVPPELLALDHRGYAAEGVAVRKGERNLHLAALELRDRLDDRPPSP